MPFSFRCIPQPSVIRATLSRIVVLCLALAGMLAHVQAHSAQVAFQWDYPASTAAGFYLYCGISSGVYPTKVDVGNATTYTLAGLTEGAKYYCAATAYDAAKVESDYSTELPVTVPYAPPVAAFTMSPASGTAPLTVQFTNASTGNVTSYAWSFGDGGTSTLQSPSHVYTTAGVRTVTLTTTGAGGSNAKTASVTVGAAAAPVANFTMTPVGGPAPLSVAFTNTSTGSTSYSWNFGDGTPTSSLPNPAHVYNTPGSYTVTLIATGAGGSNTKTGIVASLVRWAGRRDFNNDGISDLVLKNSNNAIRVWSPDGSGNLKQSEDLNVGSSFGAWAVVGVGDFNGDGIPDLLLQNAGFVAAWCPDASGKFKQWIPINGGGPFGSWAVVGVDDFNGDGIPDLLLQSGGFLAVWCPDASGNFKQWMLINGGGSFGSWAVVGVGDFNGDGIPDILLWNAGYLAAWCPDASGTYKQWKPINGGGSFGPWVVAGVGEFNGDGIPDILVESGGYTAAWCPDASGSFKQWIPMAGGDPFTPWSVVH